MLNSYFVNRLLGNYFSSTIGGFCELTIDNEQLTIMVSLRDEFEYFGLEHRKNPIVLPDYRIFLFIPEGDSFSVNYQL